MNSAIRLPLVERFLNNNTRALGGAHMVQIALCAATDRRHRKRRDVWHTQFDLKRYLGIGILVLSKEQSGFGTYETSELGSLDIVRRRLVHLPSPQKLIQTK